MKQFEYMYFDGFFYDGNISTTMKKLKELGKEGWDIGASLGDSRMLVLKRELTPSRTQAHDYGPGY
jgi:hypothetical protein